ncbi:hypothetical protein [Geminisphaera colitermitum]|uniref:hypothetical protein n=1 Tax=Geminisphaera colitermitum TaxID=1148786 RepID=UPI0012FF2715|nr:hypothetical protein [Geminisphaera colitermitum]
MVLTPAWFIWRFYNPPLPSSPELAEETPLGGQDAVSVIPTALIPDAQEPAPAAPPASAPPDQVAETTPITVTPLEPVAQDTTLPSSSGIRFSETTAPDSASVAVTSATGAVALTDVPPPTGVATFDVPPTIEFPAPGSTVTVQEAPPAASTAGVVSHPSILLPPVIAFPPRASASSSHSAPVSDPAPAVPPPPPPPPAGSHTGVGGARNCRCRARARACCRRTASCHCFRACVRTCTCARHRIRAASRDRIVHRRCRRCRRAACGGIARARLLYCAIQDCAVIGPLPALLLF